MADIDALEARFKALSFLNYGPDQKDKLEALLKDIPNPDTITDRAKKVRLLLLRGKTCLLKPAFDKGAEADIAKALKLAPDDAIAWVAISEAAWKKNNLTEAKEALDSALRINDKCQPALCQLSRILRAQAGTAVAKGKCDEQAALLDTALLKAKAAVAIDPADYESWACLGLALMQNSVAAGMNGADLNKALAALTQAQRRNDKDPDVEYNLGVAAGALGQYSAMAKHYLRAMELDPGLKKNATGMVELACSLLRNAADISNPEKGVAAEKTFRKKFCEKLPEVGSKDMKASLGSFVNLTDVLDKPAKKVGGEQTWLAMTVVSLVSNEAVQPMVWLCVDRSCTFVLVSVYRVLHTAMAMGDVIMVPFPGGATAQTETHAMPAIEGVKGSGATYTFPTIRAEPVMLVVNGSSIPSAKFHVPSIATRHFQ